MALLLTLFTILLIPALVAFTLIREPPGVVVKKSVTPREQLRQARQLLRKNGTYRRYVTVRLLMALTGIALPFYSVYAKNVLGAQASMAGIYSATVIGARLLSNLVIGWISDHKGNRLVMRLFAAGRALTLLLALALVGFVLFAAPQGAWLPYLALPLFFLDGALFPAALLSGSNFLMELVPESERATYMGLTNTLNGIVTLLSVLGGLLVDLLGFAGLFAVALALCMVGLVLSAGLPEPRENA